MGSTIAVRAIGAIFAITTVGVVGATAVAISDGFNSRAPTAKIEQTREPRPRDV